MPQDDFQAAPGKFSVWVGLAPDDSFLLVRNAGINEVYALDRVAP